MKKMLTTIAAALAAALMSSCYQQHSTITLNKDGSGTLYEDVYFSEQAMLALGGANPEDTISGLLSETSAAARAKALGEGVTVAKVEQYRKDDGMGGRVTFRFQDINKLKYRAPGEELKREIAAKMAGDAEPKDPQQPTTFAYTNGVLTITNPYKADVRPAGDEGGAATGDPSDDAAAQSLREVVGDMAASLRLVVAPGIVDSNASHLSNDTIILSDVQLGEVLKSPGVSARLQSAGDDKDRIASILMSTKGAKIEPLTTVTVKVK